MIKLKSRSPITYSFRKLVYNYVRKKDIDEICAPYKNSETLFDKAKMYTKMFAHIAKQGFKGARNDVKLYLQLRKKPKSQFTTQDWNQLIRLYHDFFRLWPLFIIQVLPMSGPLFVLYMYTYPGSIPSWFIIDKFHEDYQKKLRVVQNEAIQYFRNRQSEYRNIQFNNLSLEQAKKLADCLYGYHRDGTKGYNKIFNKNISYFISEGISKYLIKRKLKYKFNADLQHHDILEKLTFDQKIRWKFNEVMAHGRKLKNYEDTLTAQQLKIRKQMQLAEQNFQEEGSKSSNKQKQP